MGNNSCRKGSNPLIDKAAYVAIDFRFSEIARYIDNVGVYRQER